MKESVIYQDIIQEGMQKGEVALLQRLIARRFGAVAADVQEQIQALSISQLEALAEALLDFSAAADLTAWLDEHKV